jgi:hypothetical protein
MDGYRDERSVQAYHRLPQKAKTTAHEYKIQQSAKADQIKAAGAGQEMVASDLIAKLSCPVWNF